MKNVAWFVMLTAVLLAGCAAGPQQKEQVSNGTPQWVPDYQPAGIGSTAVIDATHITALTDKQRQSFRSWYQAPANQGLTPAEQVAEFLQQSAWGFDFRGDTLVASHTMEQNAGNCLSLALLTAALADEVGVNITFQEDISKPVYKQKGALMLMAKHVRATLRDSSEQLAEDPQLSPQIIDVDYFSGTVHGKLVDRTALLAMFYRNKAAEHLTKQDNKTALAYAERAWQFNTASADSINLMAVVLGRVGQDKAAGEFYRFAIEHNFDNLMLRENYAAYLNRQGMTKDAEYIISTIDNATDTNPYNWIWRAQEALADKQFHLAKKLYNKARELAPYMVESYHGLARVYAQTGRYGHAVESLERAVEKAWDDDEKVRFQKKLLVLNSMLESGKR